MVMGNDLDFQCKVPQCFKCFQPTKSLNNEKVSHDYEENHIVKCTFCDENVQMSSYGCHLIAKAYNTFVASEIFCKKCPKTKHLNDPVDFFEHIQKIHKVSVPNLHHFIKYVPDRLIQNRKLLIFALLHAKYTKFVKFGQAVKVSCQPLD